MDKLPGKLKQYTLRNLAPHDVERVEQAPPANPFFSFWYSYQEMHVAEGQTHVKSKEIRFEDGRIKSEEFEGTLPATFHERALLDMQRLFADQAMLLLKQFAFLPFFPKKGHDE